MIRRGDAFEVEPHKFAAEASSLGLKPGEWPAALETELGNKMPLFRTHVDTKDGEVTSVEYRQVSGIVTLTVLND